MVKVGNISRTSKYAAEFIGTFMLVFCVGLIKTAGKSVHALELFGPTAIGFTLAALTYILGPISFGQFNPAVTLSLILQQAIDLKEGITYMVIQCGAGALAGLSAGTMYGYSDTAGALGPLDAGFWLGAPIVEFVYTFMLVFVYLNVVVGQKAFEAGGNNFYGLAIGLVIVAGGYGGGHVSGGAFNPAVALGMNFVHPNWKTIYLPIYMVVELLGAVFGLGAFYLVRKDMRITEMDNVTAPYAGAKVAADKANDGLDKLMEYVDADDTSEFIGSFFYALSVALNQLIQASSSSPQLAMLSKGAAWSNAASLMCVYYAVGDISGGVFNPAVTIACLVRWKGTGKSFGEGKLADWQVDNTQGFKYILAQTIGVAAAGGLAFLIYFFSGAIPVAEVAPGCMPLHDNTSHLAYNSTTHELEEVCYNVAQGFFAEFFGTFFISYTFLCVAAFPLGKEMPAGEYTAIAIGGVVIAAGYAFGPLSNALLNPAVVLVNSAYFGLAFLRDIVPISFFLAECLGAICAAGVYRLLTHHALFVVEGREHQTGYINLDA